MDFQVYQPRFSEEVDKQRNHVKRKMEPNEQLPYLYILYYLVSNDSAQDKT